MVREIHAEETETRQPVVGQERPPAPVSGAKKSRQGVMPADHTSLRARARTRGSERGSPGGETPTPRVRPLPGVRARSPRLP